jgi:hypothetical protein
VSGSTGGIFEVDTAGGTTTLYVSASGNVGIGTTIPAYLLDVSGSSRHGYRTSDTHQFTGSVSISGSLNATASWANNALTASSLVAANSYTVTNLTASNVLRAAKIAEKVVTFTPLTGSITGAPAWYRIISGSGVLDSGRVRMSANYDNSRSDIEFTYAVRNYDTDGAGAFINITRASTYNSVFNAVRVIEGTLNDPYAIDVLIGNYLNNTTPDTVTCLYESQFIGAVLDAPTFVSASATGSNSNVVKTVYTTYASGYPRIGPTYSDGLSVATYQGQLTVGYRGNYNYSSPSTNNYALLVSGSVGIGTTSPLGKLHVVSPDSTYAFSVAGATKGVRFTINSNGTAIQGVDNTLAASYQSLILGGSDLYFQTNGVTNAMYINSSGNVGIGTTNTSDKLSVVSGSTRIASSALAGALYLGNDTSNIYLQRDNSYDLSLVQNGDSNSALYLASAGNVYINIDSNNNDTNKAFIVQNNALKAGTELFRIQENGNIGIGTTTPLGKLHVYGLLRVGGAANEQTGIIALGNDANLTGTYGDNGMFRGGIGTLGSSNYTNIGSYQGIVFNVQNAAFGSQATRMIIDVNGNVGIGVTAPLGRLHITGSATNGEALTLLSKGAGSISQYYISALNQTGQVNYRVTSDINGHLGHDLYYNGTAKVSHNTYWSSWINNDNYTQGGLGIGTNSQTHGYGLTIAKPSTSGSLYVSGSTIITGSLNVSTNITCLSLTETSTEAVKYNIIPLTSQLDNVLKLKPVSFNYKTNNEHSIGLIAEEVAKIYPEFTSANNDSISYGKITSVLIQSIKELKNIIDNQQKQIEDLSNKFK